MAPQFLVIDYHPETRYLVEKTLLRKYPAAVIHLMDDSEKAIELARALDLKAAVAHRTFDLSGAELVRQLRNADPELPIVVLCAAREEEAASCAGADRVLRYEEWLRVGTVVEELVRRERKPAAEKPEVA